MHALVSHMPQFLSIHGAENPFTQQGVEKLNDLYTTTFTALITEKVTHLSSYF